jgi:hypothetical protein
MDCTVLYILTAYLSTTVRSFIDSWIGVDVHINDFIEGCLVACVASVNYTILGVCVPVLADYDTTKTAKSMEPNRAGVETLRYVTFKSSAVPVHTVARVRSIVFPDSFHTVHHSTGPIQGKIMNRASCRLAAADHPAAAKILVAANPDTMGTTKLSSK